MFDGVSANEQLIDSRFELRLFFFCFIVDHSTDTDTYFLQKLGANKLRRVAKFYEQRTLF